MLLASIYSAHAAPSPPASPKGAAATAVRRPPDGLSLLVDVLVSPLRADASPLVTSCLRNSSQVQPQSRYKQELCTVVRPARRAEAVARVSLPPQHIHGCTPNFGGRFLSGASVAPVDPSGVGSYESYHSMILRRCTGREGSSTLKSLCSPGSSTGTGRSEFIDCRVDTSLW